MPPPPIGADDRARRLPARQPDRGRPDDPDAVRPCSTGRWRRSATRSPTWGCCIVYWDGLGRHPTAPSPRSGPPPGCPRARADRAVRAAQRAGRLGAAVVRRVRVLQDRGDPRGDPLPVRARPDRRRRLRPDRRRRPPVGRPRPARPPLTRLSRRGQLLRGRSSCRHVEAITCGGTPDGHGRRPPRGDVVRRLARRARPRSDGRPHRPTISHARRTLRAGCATPRTAAPTS